MICFSIYCGESHDFGNGPRIWVDCLGPLQHLLNVTEEEKGGKRKEGRGRKKKKAGKRKEEEERGKRKEEKEERGKEERGTRGSPVPSSSGIQTLL